MWDWHRSYTQPEHTSRQICRSSINNTEKWRRRSCEWDVWHCVLDYRAVWTVEIVVGEAVLKVCSWEMRNQLCWKAGWATWGSCGLVSAKDEAVIIGLHNAPPWMYLVEKSMHKSFVCSNSTRSSHNPILLSPIRSGWCSWSERFQTVSFQHWRICNVLVNFVNTIIGAPTQQSRHHGSDIVVTRWVTSKRKNDKWGAKMQDAAIAWLPKYSVDRALNIASLFIV